MMIEILTAVAPVLEAHAEHAATSEGLAGVIEEAWGIITDPGHALAEIFYNILGDLIIVPVTVFLYKKIREPKLRESIHKEIDAEHGVTHEDCSGGAKDHASASSMELSQGELDSMRS